MILTRVDQFALIMVVSLVIVVLVVAIGHKYKWWGR